MILLWLLFKVKSYLKECHGATIVNAQKTARDAKLSEVRKVIYDYILIIILMIISITIAIILFNTIIICCYSIVILE